MAGSTEDDATSEPTGAEVLGRITRSDLRLTILASAAFYLILVAAVAVTAWGTSPARLVTFEHVLIALVPFVMLLALTGKLAEIRGPGNWGLILRHEADREIAAEAGSELPQSQAALDELERQFGVDAQTTFTKEAVTGDLEERIRDARPSTLSFRIGRRYSTGAIREYVRLHTKHSPRFRYILLNDEDGRFAGLMRYEDFLHQLELKPGEVRYAADDMEAPPGATPEPDPADPGATTGMIGDIESGAILDHAAVVTRSISIDATRKRALQVMDEADRSVLAAVDDGGRYAGVVTQDGLVRELFVDLLRSSAA